MFRRLRFLIPVLCLVSGVSGAILQCDVGGCGPLQSGWIGLGSCGSYTNVGGTGINVTLATGNPGACECRNPGGSGALANVESDLLFANDERTSPGSDFVILFSNLTAGASYRLLSYHNRSDEGDTTIAGVTITGATVISTPGSIVQSHAIMDNPAECIFVAGSGDVSVRYQGPAGGCAGCQAFLNGFILEQAGPTIGFEAGASGNPESVSPAVLTVVLGNAEGGQTYTVGYAGTGGTAANGVDYYLEPNTLTFAPGEDSKTITIDIVSDVWDEEDETIIVTLSNPTGPSVQLGTSQHTYTIIDPRPDVGFASATSSALEDAGLVNIAVNLSHNWSETVTVGYTASGTATGGGADYTLLGSGTLTFEPWQTTKSVSVDIVDDELQEGQETVILTLSNPTNAKLGQIAQHTFTINDNEQAIMLEEFVGGEFSSFNHASTIAETHDGTLVVAWYGGSSEGADDVSIWVSTNNGSGWTPRIEVDDGSNDATWNPVLFQPKTGPLLLYFKYSGSPSSWRGAVRKSYDNGQTWSERILLPTCSDPYLSSYGGRYIGPVKNKPLELPDGSLLCGSSTEHDGWQVHIEIARGDYTNDFELVGPLGPLEGIQPTFLVHDDSYATIQAICRAPGSGSPTPTTWSYDGGQSWTSLSTIGFETSKGLDAVTINNLNSLHNRWHVLAYNPSGRYPLRIAVSEDGVNWDAAIDSVDDAGDDMDYPAIIQTSDKMLHLTYSWHGHEKIKHVVINPWVLLSEPTCMRQADFDGNEVVDWQDLEELIKYWVTRCREGEWCDGRDLDQDGAVRLEDFSILASEWLGNCR
ncbi:MAG TPA: exo-alpha-sialidase [Sedimentisphaerales bacterium]|nr:exo-alpha-sialidase [Sedimentisphaerales bacterium]